MLTDYIAPDQHFVTCPNQDGLTQEAAGESMGRSGRQGQRWASGDSIPESVAKRAHNALAAIRASGNRLSAAEGKVILSASPTC
jgi:hypothetical protein